MNEPVKCNQVKTFTGRTIEELTININDFLHQMHKDNCKLVDIKFTLADSDCRFYAMVIYEMEK